MDCVSGQSCRFRASRDSDPVICVDVPTRRAKQRTPRADRSYPAGRPVLTCGHLVRTAARLPGKGTAAAPDEGGVVMLSGERLRIWRGGLASTGAGASAGGPAKQKKRRAGRGRTRKYIFSSAFGLLAFAGGLRAQVPNAANVSPQQQPVSAVPTANAPQPDAAGVRLILEGPPGAGGATTANSPAAGGAEKAPDNPAAKAASTPSFNVGYDPAKGFFIDALKDPDYPKTCDGKFPFEL